MCHDQAQLILTSFGEDRGKGIGHEVLELVDVQVEATTIFLWRIGTAECSHVHFVHKDETEQLRVHVSDFSFGEIHEENLSLVHHLANVKRTLWLTDDVAHGRVRDERTKLRREVRDHFFFFASTCLGDFVLPETPHHNVLTLAHFVALELFVHEQAWHVDEGRTFFFIIHEGQTTVTEVVLNTRPEDFVTEELDKDFHRINRRAVLLFVRLRLKQVQTHGTFAIRGVKHDDVFRTFLRNVCEHVFNQVTVWINDTKTCTTGNVLSCLPM